MSSWKKTNRRIRTYTNCKKKFQKTEIFLKIDKKKFSLRLRYNGASSYLFLNGAEIQKFKAEDSKIVATPLCLGNISKDWSIDNMKKTGFNGYVYNFSVDFEAIAVDDIKNIYMYLMKENYIV